MLEVLACTIAVKHEVLLMRFYFSVFSGRTVELAINFDVNVFIAYGKGERSISQVSRYEYSQ
jgi:hypothetical protein